MAPEVNIFETKDGYVLEAEMPGVDKAAWKLRWRERRLPSSGRRHTEAPPGRAAVPRVPGADYRRVFELDPAIDSSKISAKMDQGVLTLTLPKSERVKPRKIAVE